MPVSNYPIFPQSPYYGVANISSAFTGLTTTGTTSLTAIGSAASTNGARIDRIIIKATATTTAGMVRIWIYAGSGNAQLLYEIPVSAITISASQDAFSYEWTPEALFLPSGYTLYASTHNAEAFNVHAFGGTF